MAPVEPFAKAQKEVLGDDHAYPMIAYGTLKTSAAWKLYAKSQGIPFEVSNEISAQIKKYEDALKHADDDDKDFISVYDYISGQYIDIFNKSADYQGLITSWSIAPCSYLLYSGSIREEIGLVRVKDNLCCIMDGHWAEECHFLKNDLLKVSVVDLIYRTFHRIGMEPFSVTELLSRCQPGDDAWKMYHKSCTCCLNQVEKTATSARVAKYSPTNISELCAFVAAIRPGFKSMYKTFEAREPFSYGVKSFDDLIQTEYMPNSFVLYQEMEMAALNYAGIPMSECYAAIKNIAKKRVEKVLAYKEKFIKGFSEAIMRDENKSESGARALADMLWQVIEDSASYSFNASHSYCVAVDSLYSAWLKAHYPLEFYETTLKVYEAKGDKDKMNALKQEAEQYFRIKFPPFKFGQDNREIKLDKSTNSIINALTSIKGYGKTVSRNLYDCSKLGYASFFDVLVWLNKKSIKRAKIEPLVKIDYFSDFGNSATLIRMLDFFDFLKEGTAKTIAGSKMSPEFIERFGTYMTNIGAKGNVLKTYTITDMHGLLRSVEAYVLEMNLPDVTFRVKAQNMREILGYVDIQTGNEDDRRKLYITSVVPLKDNFKGGVWKYRVNYRSLGSGKESSMYIFPQIFDKKPFKEDDIIQVMPIEDGGIYKLKDYWHIRKYEVLYD